MKLLVNKQVLYIFSIYENTHSKLTFPTKLVNTNLQTIFSIIFYCFSATKLGKMLVIFLIIFYYLQCWDLSYICNGDFMDIIHRGFDDCVFTWNNVNHLWFLSIVLYLNKFGVNYCWNQTSKWLVRFSFPPCMVCSGCELHKLGVRVGFEQSWAQVRLNLHRIKLKLKLN